MCVRYIVDSSGVRAAEETMYGQLASARSRGLEAALLTSLRGRLSANDREAQPGC